MLKCGLHALAGLPCLLSWGLTSWMCNLRQGESHVLGEENTAVGWGEGVFCLGEILVQNWGSFLQCSRWELHAGAAGWRESWSRAYCSGFRWWSSMSWRRQPSCATEFISSLLDCCLSSSLLACVIPKVRSFLLCRAAGWLSGAAWAARDFNCCKIQTTLSGQVTSARVAFCD